MQLFWYHEISIKHTDYMSNQHRPKIHSCLKVKIDLSVTQKVRYTYYTKEMLWCNIRDIKVTLRNPKFLRGHIPALCHLFTMVLHHCDVNMQLGLTHCIHVQDLWDSKAHSVPAATDTECLSHSQPHTDWLNTGGSPAVASHTQGKTGFPWWSRVQQYNLKDSHSSVARLDILGDQVVLQLTVSKLVPFVV